MAPLSAGEVDVLRSDPGGGRGGRSAVLAARAPTRRLGPLSWVARRGKVRHFLGYLGPDARILDVGCADNWFKAQVAPLGYGNVTGLDLHPPADVVGDVFDWRALGLEAGTFDAIVAFEVLEHGRFEEAFIELLKPDGLLLVTTPVPALDPLCRLLEALRLLQRRTSPHDRLIDLRSLPRFEVVDRRIKAGVSQWGVLRPEPAVAR